MSSGLKDLKIALNLAHLMKKLCKVIPSYAKKVYKHTIIGLQQNCGKWLKYSKIKHFRRLNINDKNPIRLPRQHLS